MAKVKLAHQLIFFMCDHCAAVHIGMLRDGKLFAEAIPADIEAVAQDLANVIADSRAAHGKSGRTH